MKERQKLQQHQKAVSKSPVSRFVNFLCHFPYCSYFPISLFHCVCFLSTNTPHGYMNQLIIFFCLMNKLSVLYAPDMIDVTMPGRPTLWERN